MKKILLVGLIAGLLLGFYFYKPRINAVDYKKYKYYDEEYIDKYSGKILKNYDEYLEFIGNQGLLLNKKDFEKNNYAIIFIYDSCSSKYLGIRNIDYGNSKENESIVMSVNIKDFESSKCNNQKIVLVPLNKDKSNNHEKVNYSFISS